MSLQRHKLDVKTHDSPELFPQLKNSAAVTVTEIKSDDFGHLDFLWSPAMRDHFDDLVGGTTT